MTNKQLFLAALALVFTITSCTKSASTVAANIGTGIGAGAFTWTDGTTAHICDSAYASANFKTIFAYKGGTSSRFFFEINLSSLAPANYTVGGVNAIAYIRPSNPTTYQSVAGGVAITTNANNAITGTGVASITATERINFVFTNLPIR